MNLITLCVTFLLPITVIVPVMTLRPIGVVPQQRTVGVPEKPIIANTFQAEVEGIFKDQKAEAYGTLYFDRPNNIAAMDMLWQNDFFRKIYSFDTNEIISVKELHVYVPNNKIICFYWVVANNRTGYSCDVETIPDNSDKSFFPFSIDSETKRKMLGPPEAAIYFTSSDFKQDSFDGPIESYMYQGYIDLPMYEKKNCSIVHDFSKPDFETARCDSRFCNPILLSVSVYCAAEKVDVEGEVQMVGEVDHIYRFFNFMDAIQDESVFHPSPGIHCDRKNSKSFPSIPMYFSFSYDRTENAVQVGNAGGLKTLHKKVWYDGDLELMRVDGFDEDGFLQDTRIYDFYNEMAYSWFPQLNETTKQPLDTGLSLQLLTLLPPEVFPGRIQESWSSPVFVGLRKIHGLEYHVWSALSQDTEEGTDVVTELYFQTIVSERNGEVVKDAGQQLSFIEIYSYIPDEETDTTVISEIIFIAINNFRNSSRDLSAFDVSPSFDEDEKRAFEMNITDLTINISVDCPCKIAMVNGLYLRICRGPSLIVGTKDYSNLVEQIYLEIVTLASVSITRIGKLEMIYSDPVSNSTTFTGRILECLNSLGYGKRTNESDLNTTFSILENLREGGLEFTITDKSGMEQKFVLKSFREAGIAKKDEDKKKRNDKTKCRYSAGLIAAVGIIMFIVGLVVGIIGLIALKKRHVEGEQNVNTEGQTSKINKLFGLKDFSVVS